MVKPQNSIFPNDLPSTYQSMYSVSARPFTLMARLNTTEFLALSFLSGTRMPLTLPAPPSGTPSHAFLS